MCACAFSLYSFSSQAALVKGDSTGGSILESAGGTTATGSFVTAAAAAVALIPVDGYESWDLLGDPSNLVVTYDFGAPTTITGLGWDVTITPSGDSWYSEAIVAFSDSVLGQQVFLTPGAGDTFSNSGVPLPYNSGGIIDLTDDAGIPDIVLADGILRLEFHESFDDVPDVIDAVWYGTLSVEFTVVPVPAAVWLFGSGLLGLVGMARRKKAA